jgi:hypothetical protein
VRVIDPRHPLFGQTFRLMAITTWRQTETQCVIWLQDDGLARHIPLAVTNRAPDPPVIFPVMLNLVSLQRLCECFQAVGRGFNPAMEVTADEPTQSLNLSLKPFGDTDTLHAGMEPAHAPATPHSRVQPAADVLSTRPHRSTQRRKRSSETTRSQPHGGDA